MIEIATYNPNYKMIIMTQVSFEYTSSGLLVPFSKTRAIRTSFYRTSLDYFRAVLEIIFVVYNTIQNIKHFRSFLRLWLHTYHKVRYISTY